MLLKNKKSAPPCVLPILDNGELKGYDLPGGPIVEELDAEGEWEEGKRCFGKEFEDGIKILDEESGFML